MDKLTYNYFFINNKVINNRLRESHISNKFPSEHSKILKYSIENNLENIIFSRKIWHYIHDIKKLPDSKWKGFKLGYNIPIKNHEADLKILDFLSNGKVDSNKIREKYVENNFNNHYHNILSYCDRYKFNDLKFVQKIWHYITQSNTIPKCKICGKDTNWKGLKSGYRKFCSHKCSSVSKETKKKKILTVNKKYGVYHVLQSENIKNKIKNKLLEKHGVDHVMKLKETKDKRRSTINNKYGVDNVSQIEEIKTKISNGIKDYYSSNQYLIDKKNKYYDKLKSNGLIIKRFLSSDNIEVSCVNCKNTYETSFSFINQRLTKYNINACKVCLPKLEMYSSKEKDLYEFIKSNYSGKILENDRTLLKKSELDIYLPYLKLAFEFNELYWHNELYKEKKYHLNKTNECLDNQTQLIHIYEDDWIYKKKIVKSRILNLLGKSDKIYARKCNIKEVSPYEAKYFLNENHIQGFVKSNIKLGLYYDNELVSLMTFGGLRKNLGQTSKDGHYELLRFCNKLGYSVIGGASKLFKYFIRNYYPDEIISYADRSWSNGVLYKKLGFEYSGTTNINYCYVIDGMKENRYKYRKSELVKDGYDENMTEHEIMLSRNIYRIYDSGSYKFTYNLNKLNNSH